jgi:hypothetical protein
VEPRSDDEEPRSDEVESRSDEVQSRSDEVESRSDELEPRSDEVEPRSDEVEPRSDEVESRSDEVESRSDEVESRSAEEESASPGSIRPVSLQQATATSSSERVAGVKARASSPGSCDSCAISSPRDEGQRPPPSHGQVGGGAPKAKVMLRAGACGSLVTT